MSSSWVFVCSTAFVWAVLGSASGVMQKPDSSMLQRPVDQAEFLSVMRKPDSSMLQRPVNLAELFKVMQKPDSSMLQRPVDQAEFPPEGVKPEMTPRGRRPGFEPVERYPVQFPLGRPTSDNLQAICLYGDRRPRYPKSYFPRSGFGSQVRRGSAVNKAESLLSTCCKGNQTWAREVTLCCATWAWEQSIKSFCKEEFSIKTSHYHCCSLSGTERLNCFNDYAPNPNYEPTVEIPMPPLPSKAKFKFNPSICLRSARRKIRKH